MGLASTKLFLSKGAKVMVTDINEEDGVKLDKELGEKMIFVKADMTKTEELEKAVDTVTNKWGSLDVLMTCAGVAGEAWGVPMKLNPEKMAEGVFEWNYNLDEGPASIEKFKADIAINLTGNYDAARLAAWEMLKNQPNEDGERGVIIFISSIAVDTTHSPGYACGYAAAKSGIIALTKEMACNLGPGGIRVNCIKPGFFDTPLVKHMAPFQHLWTSRHLFPKRAGDPKDIATMAAEIIGNVFVNNSVMKVAAY